jgi:transcriptional regulator with XRE-family HTH domain
VTTLQQQFGNLIRSRRKAAGLGQEALADKATLHCTQVSLLERGKRMPSLQVVKKLAAALDTTMASLMEELENSLDEPASGPKGADWPKSGQPSSKQTPAKSQGRKATRGKHTL